MRYNEASNVNGQALAIEDAEARILLLCKKAVLELYTRERFRAEVEKIIREVIAHLKSERLKMRVYEPLWRYALKTYATEVALIKEKAMMYAVLIFAFNKNHQVPQAQRLLTLFKGANSRELTDSPGFKYWSEQVTRDHSMHNLSTPLGELYRSYTDKVKKITHELVMADAKEDYSTNVNLRNIAEMTVRYEHQLEMRDTLKEQGVRFVYILPHANCSERCAKYQVGGSLHPSGLYSLDGSTGRTPDGIQYKPLEFATDNPRDLHITRAGKQYQNGCITGFNCRHVLQPYKQGIKPAAIPENVIRRTRALEEKQRAFERDIRLQKRIYAQNKGINPAEAVRAAKQAKLLEKRYIDFSVQNRIAYFTERTRIFDDL